eukprot:1897512-Rhodomonas_salina.7
MRSLARIDQNALTLSDGRSSARPSCAISFPAPLWHVTPSPLTGAHRTQIFDFRAYGRWIAGHKMQGRDVFVGACEQQNVYILPEFNPLRPPRATRPRDESAADAE